ncbi:MAG: fibronectin type III domain-containing protein [Eubacterium sp.]|nr:fibronectin type III domain-containing protein [Eubacterium sp.]
MKKTLSILLSIMMLLSVTAGLSFNAYAGSITNTTVTIPDNLLKPTVGTQSNAYDVSGVTFSRSGDGLINTASIKDTKYQVRTSSSWSNLNATDKFEVGKVYRLKVQIDAGGNNDSFATGVTCNLNGKSISEIADEYANITENCFYVNRSATSRYLYAYYYIGMMTQQVNNVKITNAPTVEPGQPVKIPVGLKIDDHINITDVDIEIKDGDTWKSAAGTNYICDTKYRFNIAIKCDEGYYLKNSFQAQVNTSWYSYGNKISDGGKTGVVLCEFPNAPVKHTEVADAAVAATFKAAGKTAGSHCSVCNAVITPQTVIAKLGSPKLSKVVKAKKAFTAKWKKVNGIDGYQVRYSLKKNMKKSKTVNVKNTATSKKISKLKRKKTYYVQIRAYKTINGKKVYSSWSAKKKVKTK